MAETTEHSAQTATDAQTHGATGTDGTSATTQAGHGAQAQGAFPPFDSATFPSQLLWLAIAFGLLYFLMSRVALPQVGAIIGNRQDRISRDIADAGRMKRESEEAAAAYEQALAEARGNASSIAQKARDEAKAAADAERKVAEAAVAGRIAAAEASIRGSKAKAMKEVERIATETAGRIIPLLAGGKVSRQDIEKAVRAASRR